MAELRVKGTGTLKLFENDNTSSVTIASPASLGADRTVTLPDADVTLVSGTMSTGLTAADITGQTALGAKPADTDEFVLSDAGVLKRVDYSFLSANRPAFSANGGFNGSQYVCNNVNTKVILSSEYFDTDGTFDSTTNYRFTVPAGGAGNYFFAWSIYLYQATVTNLTHCATYIYKNSGAVPYIGAASTFGNSYSRYMIKTGACAINLADGDYIELYGNVQAVVDNGCQFYGGDRGTYLTGFKIS